jgi:hypothetical protein
VTAPTTTLPAPSQTTVTDRWAGSLAFPDDVATTYVVDEVGGPVDISLHSTATASVSLRISCEGATARRTGVAPLSVVLSASAGSCTVVVALPIDTDTTVAYRLDATVNAQPPAGS